MDKDFPLNQILYGPPGIGKTYSAVRKALEIIEGNASNDINLNSKVMLKTDR